MKMFRKKFITEFVISLIVIGAIALGLMFFGFNISTFTKRIAFAQKELYRRSTSLESLAALRSEYTKKAESYLNILYNVIPQKDELIDFSDDFESLAGVERLDYGFAFVGETPPTGGELGSVKFNLTLGGTLNRLLAFLENLQNFRYLISLDNLSLGGDAAQTKMTIQGRVFFR